MSRCCYTHSSFRTKIDGEKNFLHDDTDQCWMSDVGNFGSGEEPEFYCVFHAPENEEPGDRGDWPVDERGKIQAKRLHELLDAWNAQNEGLQEPKTFLLPRLKCGVINLCEYKFSGPVVFASAIFSDDVSFASATFSGYADFASATFSDYADFTSATFSGYTSFISATFSDDVSFVSATFSGHTDFVSATFSDYASFASATFKDVSTFNNSTFYFNTYFSKTHFKRAPEFHGATLHQGTYFLGAEFIDRESPYAPPAYCTLKLAMGAIKAHQEEAWFYALEQESRRKQLNTPFRIKVFSLLYQWLSDYGQNFFRPLGWLAGMTVAFWWIYGLVLGIIGKFEGSLFSFLSRFTINQLLRPFAVWTERGIEPLKTGIPSPPGPISDNIIFIVQLVATLQSLLGLTLVTLFLLAVRREFKMG